MGQSTGEQILWNGLNKYPNIFGCTRIEQMNWTNVFRCLTNNRMNIRIYLDLGKATNTNTNNIHGPIYFIISLFKYLGSSRTWGLVTRGEESSRPELKCTESDFVKPSLQLRLATLCSAFQRNRNLILWTMGKVHCCTSQAQFVHFCVYSSIGKQFCVQM